MRVRTTNSRTKSSSITQNLRGVYEELAKKAQSAETKLRGLLLPVPSAISSSEHLNSIRMRILGPECKVCSFDFVSHKNVNGITLPRIDDFVVTSSRDLAEFIGCPVVSSIGNLCLCVKQTFRRWCLVT